MMNVIISTKGITPAINECTIILFEPESREAMGKRSGCNKQASHQEAITNHKVYPMLLCSFIFQDINSGYGPQS
eukprot:scaffold127712_cov43-Prasinocladus_malaysianus.AAC.2